MYDNNDDNYNCINKTLFKEEAY